MKLSSVPFMNSALQEIIPDLGVPQRSPQTDQTKKRDEHLPHNKSQLPLNPGTSQNDSDPQVVPVGRAEKTSWAMNNSLTPAYMVTMVGEIDASALIALRAKLAANGGKAPSFTALVMKAAALTMKLHPEANRAILGPMFFRRLIQFSNIDISVAVEKSLPNLPGQAFATNIANTLDKSLGDISKELADLATCTEETNTVFRSFMRMMKYVPRPFNLWLINAPLWIPSLWKKYRGCACWVNAPSKAGADLVMTTWPWPITFSFGIVKKRPFVVGDKLEVRETMPVVMVFDRRIMGGGPAGRIFADFNHILENALLETEKE